MLLGGDEIGRTQQGNNNAYCQDNEISWFDWEHADRSLLEFTRRVIQLDSEHPVFRRRGWFQGRAVRSSNVSDIAWFRPDGEQMSEQDWQSGHAKSLAVFLNGDALREMDEDGNHVRDDSFLLLFNAHHEPLPFTMPPASFGDRWRVIVDTNTELGERDAEVAAGEPFEVASRAMIVLSRPSQRR
jgi:isoamylase